MKVVDASVLVAYLAEGERNEAARNAVGREAWVWAPALVDAEVGSALRRQLRAKEISPRKARDALDGLLALQVQRIPLEGLVGRAWQLRDNVSFYDALYVALAEELGVPLLTLDQRLARAPGLRIAVDLIAPV